MALTEREKEYKKFLRSKIWKDFRLKVIKKRKSTCEACGLRLSPRQCQVHHGDYTRFGGRELQKDVFLLCKHCHRTVHKIYLQNGKKDLMLVTKNVIRYMQRLVLLKALDE